MLNWFAKLLLTNTAIAPLLLTYAWVAFRAEDSSLAVFLVALVIILALICVGLLNYAQIRLESFAFSVTSVGAADRENMDSRLLYLMPLFTTQFNALNWDVVIPAVVT